MAGKLIIFGPGPAPLIADGIAYAFAALLVQILMYWIDGPPASERLARTKGSESSGPL